MKTGSIARRLAGTGLLLASLLALTHWLYASNVLVDRTVLSPQSQANRRFVDREGSWGEALERYRETWTPLYPLTLRAATAVGVPLRRVNQLLLYATLAWMFWFVRSRVPEIHWGWPLLFFSIASFHYNNLYQYVPESLFVPLGLGFFSALLAYRERPSVAALLTLSLLGAAACLTKYIGLFWLLPLAAAYILVGDVSSVRSFPVRLSRAALFCLISVLPVGFWMMYQYRRTGFLTGIDRLEPRAPSAELAELTSFGSNTWFTVKSTVIDFFSFFHNADHATINQAYRPDGAEVAFVVLAIWALLANRGLFRGLLAEDGRAWRRQLGVFLVGYVVVLLGIWTVGNNDPIYSRFVYPAYPFLVLLGFALYGRARDDGGLQWWQRAPFLALYALLIVVHVHKAAVLRLVVHTRSWS